MPAHILHTALCEVLQRIDNAAASSGRPTPRLLAVSKTRTATEVAELATALRQVQVMRRIEGEARHPPAFGENYVQEARAKQDALARLQSSAGTLEWHLIGHLQSNKAGDAAVLFDWVQTVDRPKLVAALARHRPCDRLPLNLLVQVNIDDEVSKHGCRPEDVPALASTIAAEPRLALRGLMAIPAPVTDPTQRDDAFTRMRTLFDALARQYPQVDTLSMGMSEDLELAITEGATMVRVGTALFGQRDKDKAPLPPGEGL